jgi:hypothetical protein
MSASKKNTVFCDHTVPAEDHVRGRLADAARGIDVGGDAAPGLVHDELAAVAAFADHFIASRQVHEHGGALQGLKRARWNRYPQVLADFHTNDESLDVVGVKKLRGAERYGSTVERHAGTACRRGGGKPTPFVELLVIGDKGLRNQAQDSATLDQSRTIEELIVHGHGQANHGDAGIEGPRCLGDLLKSGQGTVLERGLLKEIGAGVAGNAKFGKDDHGDAFALSALHQVYDPAGVIGAIGHSQHGSGGRHAQESVMRHRVALGI